MALHYTLRSEEHFKLIKFGVFSRAVELLMKMASPANTSTLHETPGLFVCPWQIQELLSHDGSRHNLFKTTGNKKPEELLWKNTTDGQLQWRVY